MTDKDDKDFLIQLLNELDLSTNSIDLYLKMFGNKPLLKIEIDDFMKPSNKDKSKIFLEELLAKGLCISNLDSSEDALTHYYAIPPYSALLKNYERFDIKLREKANELPDKISEIFKNIKTESGFLSNLKNYLSNFREAKSTITGNLSLIKADYEDGTTLIPELNLLLNNAGKFYEMVENVFILHFQNFLKQVENIKQEVIDNLEVYNLKKKKEDIAALIDKIVSEKIVGLNESYNEKLPEIFKKNSESLHQNMTEISSHVEKIENEIREVLFDLMYEYEQTISDQENTFNIILEKEDEKFSIFENSFNEKIYELQSNTLNFASSLFRLNAQLIQFLFEKTKQMPLKIIEKTGITETRIITQEIPEAKELVSKELDTISSYIKEKEKIIKDIEIKEEKLPLKSIKDEILKKGIITGEIDDITSSFIAISDQLDKKPGSEIAKQLEELNDYILENKGFSTVLGDIRRWITDLKKKGDLDENLQKVLRNRFINWIEKLAK